MAAFIFLAALAAACASALQHGGQGATSPAAGAPTAAAGSAPELLAQARAAFDRRPDAAAVARAAELFRAAANADPAGTEALYGAVQAELWLARNQRAGAADRAQSAVGLGQQCLRRAPHAALCDYALALALGVQAEQRPGTVHEGLALMVQHLKRAAASDPRLDRGGPDRVLAILLLRAPGWPIGPGDAEQGLEAARRAVAIDPAYPPNQLAIAEALVANGDEQGGHAAAERALALAQGDAGRDPDAPDWVKQARSLQTASAPNSPVPPG